MNMGRVKKQWTDIETLLLDPTVEDTIEFATNIGIDIYMMSFGDTMLKRYLDMKINNFRNHAALYGCAMRFLFKHSPVNYRFRVT